MPPEGNGFDLKSNCIDKNDIAKIPGGLVVICREGIELLGQPEYALLDSLSKDDSPPNLGTALPTLAVNAEYDVYPNIAEPTYWWCLDNLKTNGVDAIVKVFRDGTTLGMKANREIPVRDLVWRYSDWKNEKLYDKGDLVSC